MKRKLVRLGSGLIIGFLIMGIARFFCNLSFSFLSVQEPASEPSFTGSAVITKPVVLTWGDTIDVASSVYGKFVRPLVQIGQEVKGWEPILLLQDTQMHYDQQANYQQTRLQLALEARKRLSTMQDRISLLQKQTQKAEQNYRSLLAQRDQIMSDENLTSDEAPLLASRLQSAESAFKSASFALAQAQSDFTTQKMQQEQQISSSKLAYQDALYQYAGLTMRAPTSWTVSEILLSGDQEVEKGQIAFRLSHPIQHLEILINSGEFLQRDQNSSLFLQTKDKNLKASVLAIFPSEQFTWAYNLILQPSESLIANWEVAQVILHKK